LHLCARRDAANADLVIDDGAKMYIYMRDVEEDAELSVHKW
jgi:hypothetical protein